MESRTLPITPSGKRPIVDLTIMVNSTHWREEAGMFEADLAMPSTPSQSSYQLNDVSDCTELVTWTKEDLKALFYKIKGELWSSSHSEDDHMIIVASQAMEIDSTWGLVPRPKITFPRVTVGKIKMGLAWEGEGTVSKEAVELFWEDGFVNQDNVQSSIWVYLGPNVPKAEMESVETFAIAAEGVIRVQDGVRTFYEMSSWRLL